MNSVAIISELYEKYPLRKVQYICQFSFKKERKKGETMRKENTRCISKVSSFLLLFQKHFLHEHGTLPYKSTILMIHLQLPVQVSIHLDHQSQ
jgi:hypothetical protein